MPEETLFEKIVKKEIPAKIVYEDEHTLAFLDIRPANLGHTLVIPKKHARNIFDLSDSDAEHIFRVTNQLAKRIKEALGCDGMNLIMNNEPCAGQVIFHAHMHLIPRYNGDDVEIHFPNKEATKEELDTYHKKILEAVNKK